MKKENESVVGTQNNQNHTTKNESLSEMWEFEAKKEKYKYYRDEFLKEKIQNVKRRLERKINLLQKDKLNRIEYTTSRRREFNNCLKKIEEEIDKIFLEEFGRKLLK